MLSPKKNLMQRKSSCLVCNNYISTERAHVRSISLSFAQEYNPNLSKLVRTTLLDSFIRKNELASEAAG